MYDLCIMDLPILQSMGENYAGNVYSLLEKVSALSNSAVGSLHRGLLPAGLTNDELTQFNLIMMGFLLASGYLQRDRLGAELKLRSNNNNNN